MYTTPLTPAVFHILLALAEGDRHGYGIQQDVLRHTDGRLRMGPGTLYGTIQRLLDLDWIEESPRPIRKPEDERRRYYRLTRAGRRALDGEVKRMDELVRTAKARGAAPRPARS
jgi:DNA-binding PadR family transcriptional regulator